MLTKLFFTIEYIPKFRALIFVIPLSEFITVREETLLGSRFFFIAPCSTQCSIKFIFFERVQ